MAIYDARPSAFTQLTTVAEWENFWLAGGGIDAVDGPNAFLASFDVPGRNIVVGAGNATIRAQLWRCDASVSTAIPAASGQNRIDRLVLRYNRAAVTAPTVIQPTIITGTPSGSPVLPALTRTPTGIWDFPLCYWTSQSSGGLATLTDDRGLIMNDVWHSVSPPGGWGGGVNYKMFGDNTVALAGQIVLASSGSYNGITIATLPVLYRPIGTKNISMVSLSLSSTYGNNAGSPGLPYVKADTNGAITLNGLPSAINGATVNIDGARYPLDF